MPVRPQSVPPTTGTASSSRALRSRARTARTTRAALTAGLVAALATTAGAAPATATATRDGNPAVSSAGDPVEEKLGTHDAELLAQAKAADEPYVTMIISTRPGTTGRVADRLDTVPGASVGYTEDSVGYVRVTVRTGKADTALTTAAGMSAVRAIDLNEEIDVPDPSPAAGSGSTDGSSTGYTGPSADTPADNAYQPSGETGAVDFVEDHPRADGRGVTIGVLDTGVDISHPALQETTTGQRKITDWVTSTDPIIDGDDTWRAMVTAVSGESFTYNGRRYTAPAGDYLVATFRESATSGGDLGGDVNRDGDTTDTWALLYDDEAGTVRVDLDGDADFTGDDVMSPYGESYDVGYFGTDDPDTDVAETVPFTVEIREDVAMDPYGGDWVGKTADFVSIGLVSESHGTHVAGIAAGNGFFGGEMNGAAPGSQIVSSRACVSGGGCTSTALTEGMIDLVVNRDVDIVNMSIGGLPALNDGNSATSRLYNELIDTYGVQLFISAGNEGPGTNTVSDPSLADKVVSVAAGVSRETWAANYGSVVERRYAMFPFSSAGPRDDGGMKPTVTAPGAAISSIPTWMAGEPVAEAGYDLPAGYGMLQGTSMASPQAAGVGALLLSAAGQRGMDVTPSELRTALTSSADTIRGAQAHEQGAGLVDTEAAWRVLVRGAGTEEYTVTAPVDHVLDESLQTPGSGTGIYDRESAPAAGESETYQVTLTRTTGPDRPVRHTLSLANNHERTFRLTGQRTVSLPLNEPVTVTVEARPRSSGAHSALLTVDDPRSAGTDLQVLNVITAADDLAEPSYAREYSGTVQRNDTTSYFIRVPAGTRTLEVAMSGLAEGSQTRWIAIDPQGLPVDDNATSQCYPNYDNPSSPNTCQSDVRSYENPEAGVWEIEVEARRTTPQLDNPYTVTATAYSATFEPETAVVEEATTGVPTTVSWDVTNDLAAVTDGSLAAGELGSARTERPAIADGDYSSYTVEIGADVSEFSATIGSPADASADLDLYVYRDDELVDYSADADSEESVTLTDPDPGTYTVTIHAYEVPEGTTEYDYRDAYVSPGLGTVTVAEDETIGLDTGESAEVSAEVTVTGSVSEGRELYGEVRLVNSRDTTVGSGGITIESVTP